MADSVSSEIHQGCRRHLERYFTTYPDAAMCSRAMKTLHLAAVIDPPLSGKAEGWAAGIIYFLATDGRVACGVPGLLNSELEEFFGVSMGTIRTCRASAAAARRLAKWGRKAESRKGQRLCTVVE